MTKQEFAEQGWTHYTLVVYQNKEYKVSSVDFETGTVGIYNKNDKATVHYSELEIPIF